MKSISPRRTRKSSNAAEDALLPVVAIPGGCDHRRAGGHALVRQGQLGEAIVPLSKVVTQKPGLPEDAHVALARAFTAQGKKIEAEQHYHEALRLLKSPKQVQPAQQ